VQIGALAPEKNTLRTAVGSQGLLWGLGYRISDSGNASSNAGGGQTSLDLIQGKLSKQGSRLETSGLFYTERVPMNGGTVEQGAYYGLGLGFVRSKLQIAPTTPSSKTQFSARALVGFALSERLRLESSYIWARPVNHQSVSQLSLALGVRF
jgi:hypothetical protein